MFASNNGSVRAKRNHIVFGIVLAATVFAWVPPASASLIAATLVQCPTGAFVVGLAGRTGPWIDAIAPICARWNDRSFQPDAPRTGSFTGGSNGGPNQQSCPPGSAIAEWRVREILQGDQGFAESIQVQCRTMAPPHYNVPTAPPSFRFAGSGSNLPPVKQEPAQQNCASDELMTGLDVWTTSDGRSVSHLSLRCGKAPIVRSDMVTQAGPNGTVNYFLPSIPLPDGNRLLLDACFNWATDCGQPAADAFCRSVGKAKAISFAVKPNAGLTAVISSKRVCNAPTGCTAFARITCGAGP